MAPLKSFEHFLPFQLLLPHCGQVPLIFVEREANQIILQREDPRDVLILRQDLKDKTLDTLPEGAIIGTSAVRRAAQFRANYPHLSYRNIRGNLNTRLRKLDNQARRIIFELLTDFAFGSNLEILFQRYLPHYGYMVIGRTRLGLAFDGISESRVSPGSHRTTNIPVEDTTVRGTVACNTYTIFVIVQHDLLYSSQRRLSFP